MVSCLRLSDENIRRGGLALLSFFCALKITPTQRFYLPLRRQKISYCSMTLVSTGSLFIFASAGDSTGGLAGTTGFGGITGSGFRSGSGAGVLTKRVARSRSTLASSLRPFFAKHEREDLVRTRVVRANLNRLARSQQSYFRLAGFHQHVC